MNDLNIVEKLVLVICAVLSVYGLLTMSVATMGFVTFLFAAVWAIVLGILVPAFLVVAGIRCFYIIMKG